MNTMKYRYACEKCGGLAFTQEKEDKCSECGSPVEVFENKVDIIALLKQVVEESLEEDEG